MTAQGHDHRRGRPGGRRRHSCRAAQHGFVAGAEALAFGVLVFVFGTLVVLNGWAVLDAKFAASAAAREAVRAVVEADATDADELTERARDAARFALEAHGHDPEDLRLTPVLLGTARCAPVRLEVAVEVRTVGVPRLARSAVRTVTATSEEVRDPYRSGPAGEGDCGF